MVVDGPPGLIPTVPAEILGFLLRLVEQWFSSRVLLEVA